jgi:hypothetical protein
MVCLAWIVHPVSLASGSNNYHSTALIDDRLLFRELHKKDDPIVKWFDKGFPQTTLANGEVD